MNILRPDTLIFGDDDVAACPQYLAAHSLQPVGVDAGGGRFEALDGTCIVVRHRGDPGLPPDTGLCVPGPCEGLSLTRLALLTTACGSLVMAPADKTLQELR